MHNKETTLLASQKLTSQGHQKYNNGGISVQKIVYFSCTVEKADFIVSSLSRQNTKAQQNLNTIYSFLEPMNQKPTVKKDGASIFVSSMLQSAQENKEVKPQTRYDNVDPGQIDKLMANIKKGLVRK